MTGMIERLPGWPPVLPDLFAWVESGLPGVLKTPGPHGIRIEESLREGVYSLRAELPGVDPAEGIELGIAEGVLTLRAERGAETTAEHHTEFRYGTFARSVRLPAAARGDDATADYKDGVLTVEVPVPDAKTGTWAIPVRRV